MSALDVLYKDTITVFNRYQRTCCDIWIPTVITGVHLIVDKASLIATYGEHVSDNARVNIRYSQADDTVLNTSKKYVMPKEWRRLSESEAENHITFSFGEWFDFFICGTYGDNTIIVDSDYVSGFFNFMNKNYDMVFSITGCSKYNLIPHFGVTGK